jgi:DNA-binding HxlR family transcriptional regulator
MPVSKKEISECPIDAMLSVIDGRWKGTILWRLCDGPMRTSELRRSIPEITERMLIRHLKELVSDGILVRQKEPGAHPRVVYSISAYGRTMLPALEAICKWGRKHIELSTHGRAGNSPARRRADS